MRHLMLGFAVLVWVMLAAVFVRQKLVPHGDGGTPLGAAVAIPLTPTDDTGPLAVRFTDNGPRITTRPQAPTDAAGAIGPNTGRIYDDGVETSMAVLRFTNDALQPITLTAVFESREALLTALQALPSDALALIGYVGLDGNIHTLIDSDLQRDVNGYLKCAPEPTGPILR